MKAHLLFIIITIFLTSCSTSYNELISNQQYGKAFEKVYTKVSKNPKKAQKFKDKLLLSYNMSIEKDQNFVISQLNNNANNYYQYHTILKDIDVRYEKIKALFSMSQLSPYDYAIRSHDTDNLKTRVANNAYNHYYNKYTLWMSEIEAGNKDNARNTWEMIQGMEHFASEKHDYEEMFDELKRLGTIYTLMVSTNVSRFHYDPIKDLMDTNLDAPLMVYHTDPDGFEYDRILEVFIEDIDPGSDQWNISRRSVSKEIQVGEKTEVVEIEVCQPCKNETITVTLGDSTFTKTKCVPQPPIKKKEYKKIPIFETVCATIEQHCLTRNARAYLTIFLEDTKSNQLIYKKEDYVSYNYSDTGTTYSGDSRALDCSASSSIFLSSPSSTTMVQRLKDEMNRWTKNQIRHVQKLY